MPMIPYVGMLMLLTDTTQRLAIVRFGAPVLSIASACIAVFVLNHRVGRYVRKTRLHSPALGRHVKNSGILVTSIVGFLILYIVTAIVVELIIPSNGGIF